MRQVRTVFWTYAAAWTVLLFVPGFLFPVVHGPEGVDLDKLVHAGGYFALIVLAAWAYAGASLGGRLAALVACAIHGAATELGQRLTPSRGCDLYDWLADAVGSLMGVVFLVGLDLVRSRSPSPDR